MKKENKIKMNFDIKVTLDYFSGDEITLATSAVLQMFWWDYLPICILYQ